MFCLNVSVLRGRSRQGKSWEVVTNIKVDDFLVLIMILTMKSLDGLSLEPASMVEPWPWYGKSSAYLWFQIRVWLIQTKVTVWSGSQVLTVFARKGHNTLTS